MIDMFTFRVLVSGFVLATLALSTIGAAQEIRNLGTFQMRVPPASPPALMLKLKPVQAELHLDGPQLKQVLAVLPSAKMPTPAEISRSYAKVQHILSASQL